MRTAADWVGQNRIGSPSFGRHASPSVGHPYAHAVDRWVLSRIHHRLADRLLRLELWDGATAFGPPSGADAVTVTIGNRRALYGLAWDAEMAFGDGYSDGSIEVSGDFQRLLEDAYRAPGGRLLPWRPRLPANTRIRAHDNVHRHYDLGNDFYRLWLDEAMFYTCAYFPTLDATLERAQEAKADLVCRKLDLQPGQRVVEAGSGWGGLAIHMARRCGVRVTAYNVSHEQVAFAQRRAAEAGVADRVAFIEDDYRNIAGTFDRFVSIGMLEHVGAGQYAELGTVIDRVLDRRHGRGLLHFIGRNRPEPLSRWITSRIFPGAYPPALAEATQGVLEPWRFSVIDVENLRLHYARTLEHWLARYDAAWPRVVAEYGAQFARAWHLYLVGSIVGFTTGSLQLFQIVFAREQDNTVPWTREALCRPIGAEPRR